jgi:hypothetical protein
MAALTQGLADVADRLHHRIVGNGESWPDRGQQFFLRDDPARVLHQIAQGLPGLRPKLHRIAGCIPKLFGPEVDYAVSDGVAPARGQ